MIKWRDDFIVFFKEDNKMPVLAASWNLTNKNLCRPTFYIHLLKFCISYKIIIKFYHVYNTISTPKDKNLASEKILSSKCFIKIQTYSWLYRKNAAVKIKMLRWCCKNVKIVWKYSFDIWFLKNKFISP